MLMTKTLQTAFTGTPAHVYNGHILHRYCPNPFSGKAEKCYNLRYFAYHFYMAHDVFDLFMHIDDLEIR